MTVGAKRELYSQKALVKDVNWISGTVPQEAFKCNIKIKYRQKEQPATVIPIEDNKIELLFEQPQRAVTPGQAAVMYDGDEVLGGGTIIKSEFN